MAVWTISAQEGTYGEEHAAALARAADVPLLDRSALLAYAHEIDSQIGALDELEERFGGRLNLAALGLAMTSGAADAFRELRLRQELPELGRAVVAEAARRPGVILASAAFAALQEHPTAIHVRLRAPLEWRIESYRRHRLVDRACAEKAVKHDDHVKRAWVKTLYHVDIDDPSWFSLVVDVSRFSPDRVVETMLAAAGVEAAELAL
jgi:hypothetical protein